MLNAIGDLGTLTGTLFLLGFVSGIVYAPLGAGFILASMVAAGAFLALASFASVRWLVRKLV